MPHFIKLTTLVLCACICAPASSSTVLEQTIYPGSAPISHSELDIISLVQFGIGNLPPVDEGFAYAIRDVRVRLDIDHSWAADVEATLTFGDLTVGLIYDAARSADFASSDGHEYWFSSDGDELPEFEVIPSGTYRPTVEGTAMSSDLNLFQGIAPEGFWMLHVSDDFAADDGTFFGWAVELDLDTVVVTPEPSAALLLFAAMPLLIRRKRS